MGASMSFTFELKWLVLLPVGAIVVFALRVLWNLSREIGARKRRWVINYRESSANIGMRQLPSERLNSSCNDYSRKAW
jgi:hypothetical protein